MRYIISTLAIAATFVVGGMLIQAYPHAWLLLVITTLFICAGALVVLIGE